MIAAMFLLIMEEEDAFWMMTAVIEELLPPSYYSPSLIGVQADQMVLRGLIASCLPAVDTLLQEHDIELSLVTLNWFLTLFASVLHIRVLVRLWDLLLFEGTKVLFQASLAMIAMKEAELLKADNSAEIFNIISLLPNSVVDVDLLFETMLRTCCDPALVSDVIIEESRRRHVSSLLSKQGSWRSNLETHHRSFFGLSLIHFFHTDLYDYISNFLYKTYTCEHICVIYVHSYIHTGSTGAEEAPPVAIGGAKGSSSDP